MAFHNPDGLLYRRQVIIQGLQLMLVGMSAVFAFLTLLVGVMYASAALFASWPARVPEGEAPENEVPEDNEAIAIAIALAAHRQRSRP